MPTTFNAKTENFGSLEKIPMVKNSDFDVIVLGDLHGNALKLLHFLLQNNIVSWNTNGKSESELYQAFYDIYHAEAISCDNLINIKKLIDALCVAPETPLLRFIGDELADRGKNDLITLLLFEHLTVKGVNYRCMFSNHTQWFLEQDEKAKRGCVLDQCDTTRFYHSQNALLYYLHQGIITRNEVNHLVNNHKKHLYILDHGLYNSGTYQYTHAATSHNIGQHLARHFGLFYVDATPSCQVWSTWRINQKFQSYLNNPHSNLFNTHVMNLLSKGQQIDESEFPIECAIWNRHHASLQRPKTHPEYHYEQRSIHGHDLNDSFANETDIISLDNEFGKHSSETKEINPLFFHNESIMKPEEIERIGHEEVKPYIRKELKTLIDLSNTLSRNEHFKLLEEKVKQYQQALRDPFFAECYPLIAQLIEKEYSYKMEDLLFLWRNSPEKTPEKAFLEKIQTTIQMLKNKKIESKVLEELPSILKNKLARLKNIKKEVDSFVNVLADIKERLIELDCSESSDLLSVFRKLAAFFWNEGTSIEEKSIHLLEKKPYKVLFDATVKQAQFLLQKGVFDRRFEGKLESVLYILEKLKTQNEPQKELRKTLKERVENAKEYDFIKKSIDGFSVFITDSLLNHTNNNFLIALNTLLSTSKDKENDESVCFSVRVPLLESKLKKIENAILDELAQLNHASSQKNLTPHQIKSLLDRISFSEKLFDRKKFPFLNISDSKDQPSKMRNMVLSRARHLSLLKDALQKKCYDYKKHLDEQNDSSLNNEKKIILDNLEQALKSKLPKYYSFFHEDHEYYLAISISMFIEEFDKGRETLEARKSICGHFINSTGHARDLLAFFQKQKKIPLSKGAVFVHDVAAILPKTEDINATACVARPTV